MNTIDKQLYIDALNEHFTGKEPEAVIDFFLEAFGDSVALASSLGAEDQVLTHMLCSEGRKVRIFTLDTGRLFPETYSLIERTNQRYGINIEVFFPKSENVENYVCECGINGFYESIDNRKRCCQVRKLEPLSRAFSKLDAWICGLRHDQSITRNQMKLIELDSASGLVKINPLINWSNEQVWDYIRQNDIPYNKLHDRNFPSIGCQPCTRAVNEGEDIRSGRWWWESPDHKECGLHKR